MVWIGTLIEYVKKLIHSCPHINPRSIVFIDFTGGKTDNFSINPLPGEIVLEEYLDGASTRVYRFALNCRFNTIHDMQRLENSAFTEKVAAWMEQVTNDRSFPDMGEGQRPESIRALQWGAISDMDANTRAGVYMIQCELIYFQEV